MSDPGIKIAAGDHPAYLRLALSLARRSPPKPTNFRVGALLVHAPSNTVLSTGYTLELPGNTHAEQVCLLKLATQHQIPEEDVGRILPPGTVLYTTMEPCGKRMSGQRACVDRILGTVAACRSKTGTGDGGDNGGDGDGDLGGGGEGKGIETVYVGVKEPETFVGENVGRKRLIEAGVGYLHVEGMEEEILEVATAGHDKKDG